MSRVRAGIESGDHQQKQRQHDEDRVPSFPRHNLFTSIELLLLQAVMKMYR